MSRSLLLCRASLFLGLFALVASCNRPPKLAPPVVPTPASQPNLMECCRQCVQASSRDPAGFDIAQRPCGRYRGEWNGGPGVDPTCTAALQAKPMLVKDCRELAESQKP
ncbi:MAG: hypothetical protein JNM83_00225 [Myxococcales bacterium]|nr:hypothetical protein [Myxococcales bacterium]